MSQAELEIGERDMMLADGWRPDDDGWTKAFGDGPNRIRAILRPTIAGTWTWSSSCGNWWSRTGKAKTVIDCAQACELAVEKFYRDRPERPRPKW